MTNSNFMEVIFAACERAATTGSFSPYSGPGHPNPPEPPYKVEKPCFICAEGHTPISGVACANCGQPPCECPRCQRVYGGKSNR